MHVVGNRVIAKSLERMADSASHVALESQKLKGNGKSVEVKITKGLLELSDKVRSLIEDSFNALMKGDLKKSNECIERVAACDALERSLTADVMRSVKEVNLAVGLRAIIWDVGQMARDAESIAEVGINRNLEKPSNFCQWEKAQ
jgi:phosphate uptake regulator